jgi:type IV secretion system protein VirB10
MAFAAKPSPAPAAHAPRILVPVGTRLPLVLHNGISTRNAHVGDPLYFETLYPVLVGERIVIPAGSYVSGEITETKRPGRVKGRGEIMMRLTSMILPNGYLVSFLASPAGASTGDDDEVDKEGKIKGPSNKAGDARTIGLGTGAGAGIGAAAGGLKGLGIGAAAGAAAGLVAVLLTRGPELELPRGTTVDISLDRPLYLDAARVQFTDPGHASTLPGPPNHEPVRPGTVTPF